MLTDEQVDELVRQVPFGREPYITFRAVFRAGMMEAARIAQDAECKLSERTRELEEAKAEARRWKARAKDAEEEIDGRGRSASTEAMWKERQGDDYGSY